MRQDDVHVPDDGALRDGAGGLDGERLQLDGPMEVPRGRRALFIADADDIPDANHVTVTDLARARVVHASFEAEPFPFGDDWARERARQSLIASVIDPRPGITRLTGA
jgi:hypothetical protein